MNEVPVPVILARLSRKLETARILAQSENVARNQRKGCTCPHNDVLPYIEEAQELLVLVQEGV